MRRSALLGLACAGAAIGILAEQQAYAWEDLTGWLPDLLAGWTLIGLGLALLALRRPVGAAALLLVAGFSWFAFNFDAAGTDALRWVGAHAAYLHRAALLQLALALPAGRPSTRIAAGGVVLAWTAAIVWPLWEWDITALLLAAVFVAVAWVGVAGASGRRSRALAGRGLAAVALLCGATAVDATRSLVGASGTAVDLTVTGYALVVAVVGIVLFSAAMLDAPAALAERAVALERSGTTLRDALRDLLGDPRLEVGFAARDGRLVDDLGRPLVSQGADRESTSVVVGGREVAVVLHDPSTLADDATRSAVLAAVGLVAERARLRAEVDRQVDAVAASRRRLLLAEEDERRRLADRLDRGPGAALADVERLVRMPRTGGARDDRLSAALDQSLVRLDGMRADLELLVAGLGGIGATGLVPALERLAQDVPVDVRLDLEDVSLPAELASALWFVCAECLANTAKHADAGAVGVDLSSSNGAVRLSVTDDGRGGADAAGSGLVGLADRVAALGGELAVVSPPGAGSRVVAELPLDADAR